MTIKILSHICMEDRGELLQFLFSDFFEKNECTILKYYIH